MNAKDEEFYARVHRLVGATPLSEVEEITRERDRLASYVLATHGQTVLAELLKDAAMKATHP